MNEVEGLVVERDDALLRFRFDHASHRNALTNEIVGAMVEHLEDASNDDTVRAIALSGSGDDFCSGADWVARNEPGVPRPRVGAMVRRTQLFAHRLVWLLLDIQLPVVCTVRGWAAGLGCHIALAADFTVAAETARFWEPFGQRGFTPDSGATWLLPRLVGLQRAKDMLLLGREVSGTEAESWGLIHRAVPEAELDEVSGRAHRGAAGRAHRGDRAHQVLHAPVTGAAVRPGARARGVRARALVAQRRLQGRAARVQSEGAPQLRGSVTATLA